MKAKNYFYLLVLFILLSHSIQTFAQKPVLSWAFLLDTKESYMSNETIARDDTGNVYITGVSLGDHIDFDPGPGIHYLDLATDTDIYVAKYDKYGHFKWAFYLDHTVLSSLMINFIKLDQYGNIYISGTFRGLVDFDPGPGVHILSTNNNSAIYVAKYDNSGKYIWSFRLDASSSRYYLESYSFQIDKINDNIYIGGTGRSNNSRNDSVDFDPGPGIYYLPLKKNCGFLAKYDSSGHFIWAKTFASPTSTSPGMIQFRNICVNASGDIIVTGSFKDSIDFDPGPATKILYWDHPYTDFLAEYSNTGSLKWVLYLAGIKTSHAYSGIGSIFCDKFKNIFISGAFTGKIDFNPDSTHYFLTSSGMFDIFIAKYDSAGHFIWAVSLKAKPVTSSQPYTYSILNDSNGNILLTGIYDQVDFDPGPSTYYLNQVSNYQHFFIACYSSDSCKFKWAFNIPEDSFGCGFTMLYDAKGGIYVTGTIKGSNMDFDPGPLKYILNASGRDYRFVAKYQHCDAPSFKKPLTPIAACEGSKVVFNASSNGTDTIHYQWFKNGSLLSGYRADTLVIDKVLTTDTGLYKVTHLSLL